MNKAQKMLLGIAIGDAYGAGYEFMKGGRAKIKDTIDFTQYSRHTLDTEHHAPGDYTDDAQMSLAIAEALLTHTTPTKIKLAQSFLRAFKRDPIIGYAKGFQAFLESVNDAEEFINKIRPYSIKNGAAMRAVPLGVLKETTEVLEWANINAQVTHDTSEGITSSVTIALLAHHKYHKNNTNQRNYICDHIQSKHRDYIAQAFTLQEGKISHFTNGNKGVPCDGLKTAAAVIYILNNYSTLSDVLTQSILLGGDTDSVASIATGIRAISQNINTLPEFLLRDLRNNNYGKDYFLKTGASLGSSFLPS